MANKNIGLYSIVVEDADSLTFIERMVADSRSIGLYHTSSLSTPQQVFMDFLALTHLTCNGEDTYFSMADELVDERYFALMKALGIQYDNDNDDARYYTLIDIYEIAETRYGHEFADWMRENVDDYTFLNELARKYGVVLMYGPGFAADKGQVRVSLANLNEEDYVEIANRIFMLMDDYHFQIEK